MKELLKQIAILLGMMIAIAIFSEIYAKTSQEREIVFARTIALAALSFAIGARRQLDKMDKQNQGK